MLLGIDVLLYLQRHSDTVQGIAGGLRVTADEVERVTNLLLEQGLVQLEIGGYSTETSGTYYGVSQEGAETISRILSRYATDVAHGAEHMTVAERFLFALADDRPAGQRESLLRLVEIAPMESSSTYRGKHALELAKVAVAYAVRALEVDGETALAEGLQSIRFVTAEDAEYLASQLREHYAPAVDATEVHAVVESAAAACEAADELRPLTRGHENPRPGVSEKRAISPDAYLAVAEETAETMKAAVLPLGIDLYADAETIISKLPPPPHAISAD